MELLMAYFNRVLSREVICVLTKNKEKENKTKMWACVSVCRYVYVCTRILDFYIVNSLKSFKRREIRTCAAI